MAKVEEKALDMEELIPYRLFRGPGKLSQAVFVSVNGENAIVPRGTEVMLKRKFVEVLESGAEQDEKARELLSEY